MRVRYLSGPYTGYEETIDDVAYAEQMVAFGYAERVPDWPPPPPPDPQPVEAPLAVPDPPASGVWTSSPNPLGDPIDDP